MRSHAVGFFTWEPCTTVEGGKERAERLGRKRLQVLGWRLWGWKGEERTQEACGLEPGNPEKDRFRQDVGRRQRNL